MSKWEQIKEIKGLLASLAAGFTVVSVIGLALMDWRVSVHVQAELAKQNLGTDSKIESMDTSITDNTSTGKINSAAITQNQLNVRAAFAALSGSRPPEDDE